MKILLPPPLNTSRGALERVQKPEVKYPSNCAKTPRRYILAILLGLLRAQRTVRYWGDQTLEGPSWKRVNVWVPHTRYCSSGSAINTCYVTGSHRERIDTPVKQKRIDDDLTKAKGLFTFARWKTIKIGLIKGYGGIYRPWLLHSVFENKGRLFAHKIW